MGFLADRRILITGVLSNRSIAYGVATACQREGASLAFTYVNDDLKDRVTKLAADFGSVPVLPCDVARDDDIDALFAALQERVGRARRPAALDRLRAARGAGRRLPRRACRARPSTSAHDISSYSFAALAKGARPLMQQRNAALVTLSYLGAVRAVSNYNVMGLAKASLEANVRYLAAALGPEQIRVNGISAGPIKTLAAAGIAGFSRILGFVERTAPLRRNVTTDEVGNVAAFLLSPLASGITGEITYVDAGFSTVAGGTGRGLAVRPPVRWIRKGMSTGNTFDAVVVGAGHNGLTCAAYLAAAGMSVCVVERRAVVGGAAVTEEFHPGFRNSTASYTVSLLDPQVIRDLRLARARAGGARAAVHATSCRWASRRATATSRSAAASTPRRRRSRSSRRRMRSALPAYYAMLDRVAAILRELLGTTPPNVGAGTRADVAFAVEALKASKGFRALDLAGRARPARPLHQERGRPARSLVRKRAHQGRVRIRRGGRQFREPLHAGLGLRAPASRLRRGERQAGAVGTRRRRNGRDHAGHGRGMRGAGRGRPHERAGGAGEGRGRSCLRRRAGRRRGHCRASRRGQRQSQAPLRSPGGARARARRIFARASRRIAAARGRSA